jgi:hypothetical protein
VKDAKPNISIAFSSILAALRETAHPHPDHGNPLTSSILPSFATRHRMPIFGSSKDMPFSASVQNTTTITPVVVARPTGAMIGARPVNNRAAALGRAVRGGLARIFRK